MKSVKFFFLSSLMMIIMFFSLSIQVKAFTLEINPLSFIRKTSHIVISRVSDIIYYLFMQKKYIFDNFSDPNVYISVDIPDDIEKVLESATSAPITVSDSRKLITVSTSSMPKAEPVNLNKNINVLGQISVSYPAVIAKTEIIDETNVFFPANDILESEILKFTNIERIEMDLKPLSPNLSLNKIALMRVDDLFNNQYFEHQSPTGNSVADLAKENNYDYLLIGENLALGNFDGEQGIVTAWMESPGHRSNILNGKFTELGVSSRQDFFNGELQTIAVQVFSSPLSGCNRPNSETKDLIDTSSASIRQMQVEAMLLFNSLDSMKTNPEIDRAYYNQKIQEYNYFAQKVNNATIILKNIIDTYNLAVAEYNKCIGS